MSSPYIGRKDKARCKTKGSITFSSLNFILSLGPVLTQSASRKTSTRWFSRIAGSGNFYRGWVRVSDRLFFTWFNFSVELGIDRKGFSFLFFCWPFSLPHLNNLGSTIPVADCVTHTEYPVDIHLGLLPVKNTQMLVIGSSQELGFI